MSYGQRQVLASRNVKISRHFVHSECATKATRIGPASMRQFNVLQSVLDLLHTPRVGLPHELVHVVVLLAEETVEVTHLVPPFLLVGVQFEVSILLFQISISVEAMLICGIHYVGPNACNRID